MVLHTDYPATQCLVVAALSSYILHFAYLLHSFFACKRLVNKPS